MEHCPLTTSAEPRGVGKDYTLPDTEGIVNVVFLYFFLKKYRSFILTYFMPNKGTLTGTEQLLTASLAHFFCRLPFFPSTIDAEVPVFTAEPPPDFLYRELFRRAKPLQVIKVPFKVLDDVLHLYYYGLRRVARLPHTHSVT
jgi:hypothetical protein